jgi:hypothetical protein
MDWQQVDWCAWYEINADKHMKRYGILMDFIYENFECATGGGPGDPNDPNDPGDPNDPNTPGEDPFQIAHSNRHPARLTWGPDGKLYVSDPSIGSVFIYDANIDLVGELKSLNTPLGVAVDDEGHIYVGSNGNDRIEVYDSNATQVRVMGEGRVRMPTDIVLDRSSNLYVADSKSKVVWVYDSNGNTLSNIGNGDLEFPISVEIAYRDDGSGQEVGELYVCDQATKFILVFNLTGEFLRFYGGEVTSGGMMGTTYYWEGKFIKLQSLVVDSNERVHAIDCYMNKVQILNSQDGTFIDTYGEFGTSTGQLNLPLDIAINDLGQIAVANYDNERVEIIYTVP